MSGVEASRGPCPRSLLFVPADRASELLPKAATSRPDAVILDLEDGVLPERRAAARDQLRSAAAAPSHIPLFVRVNPYPSTEFAAGIAAVAALPVAGMVLPKAESGERVRQAITAWLAVGRGDVAVIALVETAAGVLAAAAIAAAHPAVAGIALGAEDLAAATGLRRTAAGAEILVARSLVVLAASAAGCWAIDTPSLDIEDVAAVTADTRTAADLGFSGKLAIHPAQVAAIHAGLRPSGAELDRARRIVVAAEASADRGVIAVDGRMVDRPIVDAARRTLERARDGERSVE